MDKTYGTKYCYILRGEINLKVHKCKDERPACGARADSFELEGRDDIVLQRELIETKEDLDSWNLCRRCFQNLLPVLDRLAAI